MTKRVKIRPRERCNLISAAVIFSIFGAINGLAAPPASPSAPAPVESPGRAIWTQMQAWLEEQKALARVDSAHKKPSKKPKAPSKAASKPPWESSPAVQIEGFVIPNEMEAGEVETFMLSRTPSGCVHVPLPPPSSIVFVRMGAGAKRLKDVSTTLPVQVKGKLSKGGRVDSEFEMEAESVEILHQP